MREGLKLLKLPGYYGPVYIGWLRRLEGDNYELVPGFRWVSRKGGSRDLCALASDGPGDDHTCHPPSKVAMDINEFRVWLPFCADEKAWAEYCPKPVGWDR